MTVDTTKRVLGCCGGSVVADHADHHPDCPSIVRSGLSWIEDTKHGAKILKRALAAFELILADRARLQAELDRMRPYAMRGGYGADEEWLSEC